MRPSSFLPVAGALALTLCAAGARAEHPHMRGGGMMGGEMGMDPGGGMFMLPLVIRSVGLSAEQQSKVQGIMAAHRQRFHELSGQLRTANEETLGKLLANGPLAAADLAPSTKRVLQLRQDLMQEGVAVALEIRGVLTPEQLTKAADIRKRMQSLHAEMEQLLGEHGPPPGAP